MQIVRFTHYSEPIRRGDPYRDGVLYAMHFDGIAYEVTSERQIRQLMANISREATNQTHQIIQIMAELSLMTWLLYPAMDHDATRVLELMETLTRRCSMLYGRYSYASLWLNRMRGTINTMDELIAICRSVAGPGHHELAWRNKSQSLLYISSVINTLPERYL